MAKKKIAADSSTEEKIKEAARIVFTKKGYAATRTRDIAAEAGINLALLNYYFRSKEKLFDLIMSENIAQFMKGIREIVVAEETTLKNKTALLANYYISMLTLHPDLPIFILSEMRTRPDHLLQRMGVMEFLLQSSYMKQLQQAASASGKKINPLHYFINTLALIIFPFVSRPVLKNVGMLKDDGFISLMEERKELVPQWINGMLTL